MVEIKKGVEPIALTKLKQQAEKRGYSPKRAYEMLRYPLKEEVRQQLVREQGGLCAYCMCRIPRQDVPPAIAPIIIEHYIPRSPLDQRDLGQGLDYNNLLAVCHGNRGREGTRTKMDLTCDAHRENAEFRKINPCKGETLQSIFYHLNGKIDAKDEDVRYDLLVTLNLNCPSASLVAERKAALDALITDLGNWEEDELKIVCKEHLKSFQTEKDEKTPYVGALIWYLKTMLHALE